MMRFLAVAVLTTGSWLAGGTPASAEADWTYDSATQAMVLRQNFNRPAATRHGRSDKSPIPRQIVNYDGRYGTNTIIVDTSERRLYYTLGNGKAIRYGVGVGREGFTWSGTNRITRKAEWPGWTPPPQMIRREARAGRKLPPYMPGGPDNPLGARALYIGSTLYRIHGTNQPWTIGQAMSSGCIRMANEDIIHLYDQVNVGTRVVVLR
jgi:lipoprotein-anchoring transpeptidase ErfK/SrfK